jgi:serine/threonine protein kinase
LPDTLYSQ